MLFKRFYFAAFGFATILPLFYPKICCLSSLSSPGESSEQNLALQDDDGSFALQQLCCDTEKRPFLLLLSTLDGYITALDVNKNGETVWMLPTDDQPLFSSNLGNIEFSSGDTNYRLIPSLDGNFYMYNDAVAQGIPISTETLLRSSMKLGSDVISGGKDSRIFGVNYRTGDPHYLFALNQRENFVDPSDVRDNIVIKRITQTVRAVEASSGAERWNVTVGQHEILFTQNEASCFCPKNYVNKATAGDDEERQNFVQYSEDNIEFRVSPADGFVSAYDKSEPFKPIWSKKLDSPVAQVWKISQNRIEEISLFDPEVVPFTSPSYPPHETSDLVIYIGTYDNAKYIIPSPKEKDRLNLLVVQHNFLPNEPGQLFLAANSFDLDGKRPRLAIENGNEEEECFENCPTCSSEEVNALILRDQYPKDMGWYLFKHHDRTVTKALPSSDKSKFNRIKRGLSDRFLISWWPALLAPFVAIGLIIATSVWCWFKKIRNVAFNEDSMVNTVSVKSQVSEADLNCDPVINTATDYSSWYLDHFEPLRCLGKGGFGVVIESLNKLDQQKYAVKRITVSSKPDGKERVQREVRALAKMDHTGIVRYYSTWLEEPPPSWQENWDQVFVQRCTSSPVSIASDVGGWHGSSFGGAGDHKHLSTDVSVNERNMQTLSDIVDRKLGLISTNVSDQQRIVSSATTWDNDDSAFENSNRSVQRSVSSLNGFPPVADINNRKENDSFEIVFANSSRNDNSAGFKINANNATGHSNDTRLMSRYSNTSASEEKVVKKRRVKRESSRIADKQLQTFDEDNNGGIIRGGKRQQRSYLYIQMQLCQDRTLSKWMRDHHRSDDRDRSVVLDWFDQIVCAIQYVHDSNLIHRDLKPSNIFFAQNGQLKIGDFGLAKGFFVEDSDDGTGFASSIHRSESHTDNVGTWLYMSPEQEHGDSYTFKVDIYALGLIFVELLLPFSTEMERRNVLKDLKSLKFPKTFQDNFYEEFELAQRLLSHDPDQRPTCKQIRECPLFKCFWLMRPLVDENLVPLRQASRSSQNSTSGNVSETQLS